MALAINNNLMANNVTRNLQTHYSELGKSTQRLSSGLRVSSAADDAAGLAIRELMRGDIAALGQGVRNANDAISMIQTADGALGVIDSKLIRMKELAEQSSTDTYTNEQRTLINQEYQAMSKEITRIAEDTDFNGKKLLNGAGSKLTEAKGTMAPAAAANVAVQNDGGKFTLTSVADGAITLTNKDRFGFESTTIYAGLKATNTTVSYTQLGGEAGTEGNRIVVDEANTTAAVTSRETKSNATLTAQYKDALAKGTLTLEKSGDNGTTWTKVNIGAAKIDLAAGEDMRITIKDGNQKRVDTIMNTDDGGTPTAIVLSFDAVPATAGEVTSTAAAGKLDISSVESTSTNIHFGSSSAATDSYNINIGRSDSSALGIGETVGDNVLSKEGAKQALDNIDKAIRMKDSTRADLGSTQNRLTATIDNISVQKENLQAAESRISDVDVATEMTEFNKQQILANAAVSMLSQANNLPKMAQKLLG